MKAYKGFDKDMKCKGGSGRFLAVVGAGNRAREVSYTYPNREFTYRGKPITVSYWANLPEPPSTERVE